MFRADPFPITYALPDAVAHALTNAIRDAALRAYADGYEHGFAKAIEIARLDAAAHGDTPSADPA